LKTFRDISLEEKKPLLSFSSSSLSGGKKLLSDEQLILRVNQNTKLSELLRGA